MKPEDRCTIEGTVVNAVTGEPLKKANLSLMKGDANQPNVAPYGATTDAAGRYRIENIDPGRYMFAASRNGYVRSNYGSKGKRGYGPGIPLTLSARQVMKDVLFRLTPQAVVSGRVVDEDGEPLANAQVQCLRRAFINGKRTLMPQGYSSTNDKGEYRAFGLPPGKYFVTAVYRMNPTWGAAEIRSDEAANDTYATTFYPSALNESSAIPVEVTSGAEITAIDLKLIRMRAFQLSGVVTGSPQSGPVFIMLFPKSGSEGVSAWASMRQSSTDPKGAFLFRGVMPGSYLLQAQGMGSSNQQPMMATATVEVGDSNVENIQVTFSASSALKGTLVIDGKQDLADLKGRQIGVNLQPQGSLYGPGQRGSQVKDDATFEIPNASQDQYRINVYGMPETYYVKSVRVGPVELPKEILDLSKGASAGELTIVVSPDGAQIEGSVQDKDHKPVAGAQVVAIPDPRDFVSRYKGGSTDQYGRFVIKGIAAGTYKLFAFDDLDWGAQQDAEFMKPFEDRGETLELKDGAKEVRDLKLIVTDETEAPQQKASN